MKIGVIGSGVSGLVSALTLQERFEVSLFEKNSKLGGHSNTVTIEQENKKYSVETGFIVLNDKNYPIFTSLLKHLNIGVNNSSMSFSVSVDKGQFEYSSSYIGLLGQTKNIIDPKYWGMLRDINYFYTNALKDVKDCPDNETLGQFLKRFNYSNKFIDYHLVPMTASIWSCPTKSILNFPIKSLLVFFENHKLLNIYNRPKWSTVNKGSREYVKKIQSLLKGKIYTNAKVNKISKSKEGIRVHYQDGIKTFDKVILACHADQSSEILIENFSEEANLLKDFKYQKNTSILHSDINFMPKRKSVWSSWNYITETGNSGNLSITYWMNELQGINSSKPILLSLNPKILPNPDLIYGQYSYSHPILDNNAINIQKKLSSIQGKNNLWFCGAWTGFGFHEDGVKSAVEIANSHNIHLPWFQSKEVLHAAQ
jgi:predicted NAD/FAD-binding protein|tara:strand:- start:434 stop:1711 length:1278 start_codon:yes stop_codon:yes gene_type:complete